MPSYRRSGSIVFAVLSVMVCGLVALGHPGGLDSKGGHTERKTGRYHYHRKVEPAKPAPETSTSGSGSSISARDVLTEAQLSKLITILAEKGTLTDDERDELLSDL